MIDDKLLDYAIGYNEVGGFSLDYNLIKELLIKKKLKMKKMFQ